MAFLMVTVQQHHRKCEDNLRELYWASPLGADHRESVAVDITPSWWRRPRTGPTLDGCRWERISLRPLLVITHQIKFLLQPFMDLIQYGEDPPREKQDNRKCQLIG